MIVNCPPLNHPDHGAINCSLGDDENPTYEDICAFSCDAGYELIGNDSRFCHSDGSWNGSSSCTIMECPSSSLPLNSMLAESCNSTYQSLCILQCHEGFYGTGNPSYICDLIDSGSSVMWLAEEAIWSCKRGHKMCL